jgi:hypothetical protein
MYYIERSEALFWTYKRHLVPVDEFLSEFETDHVANKL